MTYYVAVDIGCLECGEPSACLGIFTSAERARQACDVAHEAQEADWSGQHSFEVFTVKRLTGAEA